MSLPLRIIKRSPAPLALMALIFFLSAQPNLGTDLGLIDLIGRKIAHASVYAALTLLWWWAFIPQRPGKRALLLAVAISFLYAVSDEFHQSFVDGRVGSPIDVAIDSVGIAFSCWLVLSGRAGRLLVALERRMGLGGGQARGE